jgi:hypothetical protein
MAIAAPRPSPGATWPHNRDNVGNGTEPARYAPQKEQRLELTAEHAEGAKVF